MYEPVRPVVLQRDPGDKRGMDWPTMLRARAHGVRIATGQVEMAQDGHEYILTFVADRGRGGKGRK